MEGKTKAPFMIYPEGSTCNGEWLMSFKKGAFFSLLPIQPITSYSNSQIIQIGPLTAHFLACCKHPFQTLEMKFYPVFEPNDYLWTHHQKAGEEKVDTYMRIIHKIMREGGNLKDGSAWCAEDRFEYIKTLRNIKREITEADA